MRFDSVRNRIPRPVLQAPRNRLALPSRAMHSQELLTAREAARRLGIATASLYDWLAQSDVGALAIRGQAVTVEYFQGGAKGQGRIRIEAREVERLRDLMRVRPHAPVERRPPPPLHRYPGINAKLGRPDR